jgi:hypothetical protein
MQRAVLFAVALALPFWSPAPVEACRVVIVGWALRPIFVVTSGHDPIPFELQAAYDPRRVVTLPVREILLEHVESGRIVHLSARHLASNLVFGEASPSSSPLEPGRYRLPGDTREVAVRDDGGMAMFDEALPVAPVVGDPPVSMSRFVSGRPAITLSSSAGLGTIARWGDSSYFWIVGARTAAIGPTGPQVALPGFRDLVTGDEMTVQFVNLHGASSPPTTFRAVF